MKKHAKLSASGSHRWLLCAGSVEAESKMPRTTSHYADEGTIAHEIGDLCLKTKKKAKEYEGKTIGELGIKVKSFPESHIITKEMTDYVQQYVDYVLSFMTSKSKLFTEQKVSFATIVPSGFGTCDSAVVIPETKTLHVFDLKYGKGVVVDAEDNSQGMLYSIGLYNAIWKEYPCETFVIHICQPRRNHWDKFEVSFDDLKAFSLDVKEKAKLALTPNAPRVAGEKQCQWCSAKGVCEVRQALVNESREDEDSPFDMFEDISGEDF